VSIAAYAAIMEALQALDHRAMPAMMAAQPGRVTSGALTELRALNGEYRALLGECSDDFLAREVGRRVADSQEWVGRACDALGLAADAVRELEAAAVDWGTRERCRR
jgi:hypothetical protein